VPGGSVCATIDYCFYAKEIEMDAIDTKAPEAGAPVIYRPVDAEAWKEALDVLEGVGSSF
jgi:hypothetical protein